jgi:1-acyl-sn-glycerol-3-phosphate acyltransferase
MVRLALKIFCCRITVNGKALAEAVGPLLITANHPNSFLDAVIIGASVRRPVHFLARGDAFKKPWHDTLLRSLNMIPVYRLSEGKENLPLNEDAFKRSKEVLAANGIVLIFIEGVCKHTHVLQPFKKGAARIALENKTLKHFMIMPLGIAYDSFTRFGKRVNINSGALYDVAGLLPHKEEAKNMLHFNAVLYKEISALIVIPGRGTKENLFTRIILFPPALIGTLFHFPLFILLKNIVRERTAGTVFFDSVLFGALLVVYPLYLLLLAICLYFMHVPPPVIFFLLISHPLTARMAAWWRSGESGPAQESH